MHPLQQPSAGGVEGQFKPCRTRPLHNLHARPRSMHGTSTPATQGARGNHIPAKSPLAPQPRSALSQTAHRPSTSPHQMHRIHAVRARTASIAAHKMASQASPGILPCSLAGSRTWRADGPACGPLGRGLRHVFDRLSQWHRGGAFWQPAGLEANVWSMQMQIVFLILITSDQFRVCGNGSNFQSGNFGNF